MNDRHPSGYPFPADPASGFPSGAYERSPYGTYETGGYGTGTTSYDTSAMTSFVGAVYGEDDPLFGSLPGGEDTSAYGSAHHGTGHYDSSGWQDPQQSGAGTIPQQYTPEQAGHSYPVASDATSQWDTSAYDTASWQASGTYGGHEGAGYDTGAYGTVTGTAAGAYEGYEASAYDTGSYETGGLAGYDPANHQAGTDPLGTSAYPAAPSGAAYDTGTFEVGAAYDPTSGYEVSTGYEASGYETGAYDTGAYDTASYDTGAHETVSYDTTASYGTGGYDTTAWDTTVSPARPEPAPSSSGTPEGAYGAYGIDEGHESDAPETGTAAPTPGTGNSGRKHAPAASSTLIPGPQNRGRRRSPKVRRSALLTVAAPSVAVLGVAGIAAASVGDLDTDDETTQAAPDTVPVTVSAANSKLDTQLAGLSRDADDFADRASRTQERIDLKKRQEAERARKAAEAARKEALRPKFALPVQGSGISAYYGQAGVNWMSVHTGLDFPVSYGTAVKAATDGIVSTRWDPSYGNMAVVTAADGTETWYCHLSSTKIRSGSVKAGDVIGYSGNSGNSTGPHLHFEVRPGGGAAVDPLAWFRSHGLEPN